MSARTAVYSLAGLLLGTLVLYGLAAVVVVGAERPGIGHGLLMVVLAWYWMHGSPFLASGGVLLAVLTLWKRHRLRPGERFAAYTVSALAILPAIVTLYAVISAEPG